MGFWWSASHKGVYFGEACSAWLFNLPVPGVLYPASLLSDALPPCLAFPHCELPSGRSASPKVMPSPREGSLLVIHQRTTIYHRFSSRKQHSMTSTPVEGQAQCQPGHLTQKLWENLFPSSDCCQNSVPCYCRTVPDSWLAVGWKLLLALRSHSYLPSRNSS